MQWNLPNGYDSIVLEIRPEHQISDCIVMVERKSPPHKSVRCLYGEVSPPVDMGVVSGWKHCTYL